MPFFRDFFANLFGQGENNHHPNHDNDDHQRFGDRFRNPIWQNDEEDDDEYGDDYRHAGPSHPEFHFEIFTSPFEMTKYFESQLDTMMKDFFNFGFNNGQSFGNCPEIMPPNSQKKDLRDEVLKPGYAIPPPNHGLDAPKVDEDLDGKVSVKDFPAVWNEEVPSGSSALAIPENRPRSFNFRSFGQSITSQTIRRPDGSIEERRTTKDSEGNIETIIKQRLGDKSHTVVIKTDKNGVESKTENFENMDPNETKDFDTKWKSIEQHPIESGTLTRFPWHKFFDFNPKL